MSNFRRRLIMAVAALNDGEIPTGCVRCEYLESYVDANNANGQYIDTERILSNEDVFGYKVSFVIPPTTAAEKGVNGWQLASDAKYGCYIRVFKTNYFDINCGSQTFYGKYTFDNENDVFELEFNPITKQVIVNNVIAPYNFFQYDIYKPKYTMYLFTANVGSAWSGANMRIYDYWVKDKEGNYLQHLVPILDKNGMPCMYDTVNKKYHYNQRTNRTDNFRYEILSSPT